MLAEQIELATIVLCYKASEDVVGAVRSLLDQDLPTEIVVVNSGGGNVDAVLRRAGITVPCIEYPERLYVGAARNRGIDNTKAPFIAFLASDCRACPGWVEQRLVRHRSGARAVASAIANSHPRNLVACAAYIGMFMRRLPGLPETMAIRFGASFDRALFDAFGRFDESVPASEDTEFLKRLPPELQPVWEPSVQTIHLNETRLMRLMVDQFRRGIRYGRDMRRILGKSHPRIARDVLRQWRPARTLARAGLSGSDLTYVRLSMPIFWLTLAAKAGGVLVSQWSADRPHPAISAITARQAAPR
ncbi:glycosyltransferase family 2 protein [Aminobacter sp. UC22_36]|uniref:glycosyltransferase family 2 protein n=1 Tax=Aminobacter sp. UC22_36 TaxID=3374549 RepID=UPI003756CA8C